LPGKVDKEVPSVLANMTNFFIVRLNGYCMKDNRTMGGEPRKGFCSGSKEKIISAMTFSRQESGAIEIYE